MGPFVPDIITDELNLVVALLLGIAFGAVLEQAGFSSSRRLAGVFYGYDFTVLRVFFTAGITAALGVVLLGDVGWLDVDAIYVNPTFLGPAIIGGVIMGFGFVIGGYCPGTGICAAAIGKKDAMAFVLGGILGVFMFGELYPLYDVFYGSGDLGALKVFNSLGISQGLFLMLLIAVAVGAFIVTTKIERKINPGSAANSGSWHVRIHVVAAIGLVLVGAITMLLPARKTLLQEEATSPKFKAEHPIHFMTADELAFRVLDKDPRLMIVDIRTADEYKAFALPGSVNVTVDGLFSKESVSLFGVRHKERVIVDNDGSSSEAAALLVIRLGFENVRVLEGGVAGLRSTILQFKTPDRKPPAELADTYRFRAKASVLLAKMIDDNRNVANKPKLAAKKILGGC